jgi:hypothetical protein
MKTKSICIYGLFLILFTSCAIAQNERPTLPMGVMYPSKTIIFTKNTSEEIDITFTPSLDPFDVEIGNRWSIYNNSRFKFTFQYPTIYNEGVLSYCGIHEEEYPDTSSVGLSLGARSYLSISPWDGYSTLDDLKIYLLNQLKDPNTKVIQINFILLDNKLAIKLEYRFGGMGRYGTDTIFRYEKWVYHFNFTAGAFCPSEPIAYERMISSFHFYN